MMIGNVRWNIALAAIGFLLTFFLSVGNNFFVRALLHGFYSFLILFAVGFPVRWMLGTLVGLKGASAATESDSDPAAEPEAPDVRGTAYDAVTPDDDQLNDMLKESWNNPEQSGAFVPLQPQKLSTVPQSGTEQMAQAMRRMTEE